MEKVCESDHKKLGKNVWGWRKFIRHKIFLIISRYKSLVVLSLKLDNFVWLFWNFKIHKFGGQKFGQILKLLRVNF